MNQRSKATLFLIEQLIVVAVFAICAAACVKILSYAYLSARDSKDISNAIMAAESSVECFKAVAGDIEKAAGILGGGAGKVNGAGEAVVYYDKQWQVCGKDNASYSVHLANGNSEHSSPSLVSGEINVKKITGESLVTFNTAVCRYAKG